VVSGWCALRSTKMKHFPHLALLCIPFLISSCEDEIKIETKVVITEIERKDTVVVDGEFESPEMTREFFGEQFKKIEAEENATRANEKILDSNNYYKQSDK